MLNILWPIFIIISIIYAIFSGNLENLNKSIFESTESAVSLTLTLIGMTCLWSGIMEVASKTNIIKYLSKILKPIVKKLFPNITSKSKSYDNIIMNIVANILGLGNAATPLGLKAMNELQKENEDKEKLIQAGTNLGIAFQIKDDLLGLYSENDSMGKTLNDIKEGKQTIIYKYAIDHANRDELEIINKYYGNLNVTEEENKIITDLFIKLKAKENAEELVLKYTNDGIDIINSMDVKNRDLFTGFANYLLKRDN